MSQAGPAELESATFHIIQASSLFEMSHLVNWLRGPHADHDKREKRGQKQTSPCSRSGHRTRRGRCRQTEPLVAVAARTDPNEQENVVLQPDLDDKTPATRT